eukprot:XP_001690798.1 predicted protein [Chlamydomonas reinhardtii]
MANQSKMLPPYAERKLRALQRFALSNAALSEVPATLRLDVSIMRAVLERSKARIVARYRTALRAVKEPQELASCEACVTSSTLGMPGISGMTAPGASTPSDCGSGASSPAALSRSNTSNSLKAGSMGGASVDEQTLAAEANEAAPAAEVTEAAVIETTAACCPAPAAEAIEAINEPAAAETKTEIASALSKEAVPAPAPVAEPTSGPAVYITSAVEGPCPASAPATPRPPVPRSHLTAAFQALAAIAAATRPESAALPVRPYNPTAEAPGFNIKHTVLNYQWHRCEAPGAPIQLVGGCHYAASGSTIVRQQLESLRADHPSSKGMPAPQRQQQGQDQQEATGVKVGAVEKASHMETVPKWRH